MNDQLVELLASPLATSRQLAFALLGDEPCAGAGEIMAAMASAGEAARTALGNYVRARFVFMGEPYEATTLSETARFGTGTHACRQERTFLGAVDQWLQQVGPDGRESAIDALAGPGALRLEFERLVTRRWGNAAGTALRRASDRRRPRPERQIGFAPTYKCNLSCAYCLSRGMDKIDAPFHDVERLLSWASREGVRKLHLYGGEPTIYPFFARLLATAAREGLEVYFPSNLVASEDLSAAVAGTSVSMISAHVPSSSATRQEKALFWRNAAALKEAGIEVRLRYNLQDEDWSFLRRGCERIGSRQILFSPIVQRDAGQLLARETWRRNTLLALRFADDMLAHGLHPTLAKTMPLCLVAEGNASAAWHVFRGHCGAHHDDHTANAHIRPDMKVALCNGDEAPARPCLWDFSDWPSLQKYVGPRMRSWQARPLWPECNSCYYRARGLCQGACLVAKGFFEDTTPCDPRARQRCDASKRGP